MRCVQKTRVDYFSTTHHQLDEWVDGCIHPDTMDSCGSGERRLKKPRQNLSTTRSHNKKIFKETISHTAPLEWWWFKSLKRRRRVFRSIHTPLQQRPPGTIKVVHEWEQVKGWTGGSDYGSHLEYTRGQWWTDGGVGDVFLVDLRIFQCNKSKNEKNQ